MANYSIDDKAVNDCALEFERVDGSVKQKHTECDGVIKGTQWEGQTAVNFKAKAEEWLEKMNLITDELLFMRDALNDNSNRAVETDAHNYDVANTSFVN